MIKTKEEQLMQQEEWQQRIAMLVAKRNRVVRRLGCQGTDVFHWMKKLQQQSEGSSSASTPE